MARQIRNLKGQKFGRLIPDSYETIKDEKGISRTMWTCFCSCGKTEPVVVRGNHLTTGRVQSCGCVRKEASRARMFKLREKLEGQNQ